MIERFFRSLRSGEHYTRIYTGLPEDKRKAIEQRDRYQQKKQPLFRRAVGPGMLSPRVLP